MVVSYNSIVILYEKLSEFEKAEYYYKKGLEIINKDTVYNQNIHYNFYGNLYMNLANAQLFQQKNDTAIINYNNSVRFFKKLNNRHRISYILNNIATLKMRLNQYDSVIFYANKSLNLKKKVSALNDFITNYRNLSEAFRKKGFFEKSLEYALKQKEIIDKSKKEIDISDLLESYYDIALSFKANKRYKDGFTYLLKYISLKDSVINEKKNEIINRLETKFQTKQKESEILRLSNENLKKETILAKSKNTLYIISSFLLISLMFFIFYWYKRKQKEKLLVLESTIKATEEEKKLIGKELHDGIAGTLIRLIYDVEEKYKKLSKKLYKTYNEIRLLSHQLNNTNTHNDTFMERLIEIIPENKENQHFSVKIKPVNLKVNEPIGTHIFRIIQELITNNLKHAKASQTDITIEHINDKIYITYKDNGINNNNYKKGNGITNINDRIKVLKGKLNINNNNGFTVEIEIPYKI
jgi:signal transduction histidine kinase